MGHDSLIDNNPRHIPRSIAHTISSPRVTTTAYSSSIITKPHLWMGEEVTTATAAPQHQLSANKSNSSSLPIMTSTTAITSSAAANSTNTDNKYPSNHVAATTSNPSTGIFHHPSHVLMMWQGPHHHQHLTPAGAAAAAAAATSSRWQPPPVLYPSLFQLPPPPPPPPLSVPHPYSYDDDDDDYVNDEDVNLDEMGTAMSEEELEDLVVWDDHQRHRNPFSSLLHWKRLLWCWRVSEPTNEQLPPKLPPPPPPPPPAVPPRTGLLEHDVTMRIANNSKERRAVVSPSGNHSLPSSPSSSSSTSSSSSSLASYHSFHPTTAAAVAAFPLYHELPPPPPPPPLPIPSPPPPPPPPVLYSVNTAPVLSHAVVSPSPPQRQPHRSHRMNEESYSSLSVYYDAAGTSDSDDDDDDHLIPRHYIVGDRHLGQQHHHHQGEEKKEDAFAQQQRSHKATFSNLPKPQAVSVRIASAPAATGTGFRSTSNALSTNQSTVPAPTAATVHSNGNAAAAAAVTTKSGRPPLVQRSKSLHPKPPVPPALASKPPVPPPQASPSTPPLVVNGGASSNHHHGHSNNATVVSSLAGTSPWGGTNNKGIAYNRARTSTIESRGSTLTTSSRHRRTKEHYDFSPNTIKVGVPPRDGIPEMVHITITYHPDDYEDDDDVASSLGDSLTTVSYVGSPKRTHVYNTNKQRWNNNQGGGGGGNSSVGSHGGSSSRAVPPLPPSTRVGWTNEPGNAVVVNNIANVGGGFVTLYDNNEYSDDDEDDDSISLNHLTQALTDDEEHNEEHEDQHHHLHQHHHHGSSDSPFALLDRRVFTESQQDASSGAAVPKEGWVLEWVNQSSSQNDHSINPIVMLEEPVMPDRCLPTKMLSANTNSSSTLLTSWIADGSNSNHDSTTTFDSSWRVSHTFTKDAITTEYLPQCYELEQSFRQVVLSGWIAYSVNDEWEMAKFQNLVESHVSSDDDDNNNNNHDDGMDRNLKPLPRWNAVERRHLAYMVVCRGEEDDRSSSPTLTLIPASAVSSGNSIQDSSIMPTTIALTDAWQCSLEEISRQHGRCVVLSSSPSSSNNDQPKLSYTFLPISLPLFFFEPPTDAAAACCSDSWRRLLVSHRKFAFLAPCMFPPFCHTQTTTTTATSCEHGMTKKPTKKVVPEVPGDGNLHTTSTTTWTSTKEQQPQDDEDHDNEQQLWDDYWDSFAPDEQHDASLHILFTLDALIKQGMRF